MMTSEPNSITRSLDRALRILCVFNRERQSLTLTQLGEVLGLPKATVFRLCATLLKYRFLLYEEGSKRYSLGPKLFDLGTVFWSSLSLRRIASPHLMELQAAISKNVSLAILEEDELLYIDRIQDKRSSSGFGSEVGWRRPPHYGVPGQVLLAFLPDREVDRLLEKSPLKPLTKKSVVNKRQFKEMLRAIREQGFVVEMGTVFDGITGIGAPIRDSMQNVVAALGVTFISSLEDGEGIKRITVEVVRAAQAISSELGYRQAGSR
jgi:IclR family transcriptional regulator, KDG regulon repressor